MPVGNRHVRDSGKSVIDVLVACAVLGLLGCMVIPALSKERDDARIAQCADHLKQLGQAAHQYAADFEGKFFYDWSRKEPIQGIANDNTKARWWDAERVGAYVEGERIYWNIKQSYYDSAQDKIVTRKNEPAQSRAGVGMGTLVCPSDVHAARSYNMNFWASGIEAPDPLPIWPAEIDAPPRFPGQFFDSNSGNTLSRLILFGESLGFLPVSIQNNPEGDKNDTLLWATYNEFGSNGYPSERFSSGQFLNISGYKDEHTRWGGGWFPTQFDYARHGGRYESRKAEGAFNIAYADGHIAWRTHQDLYDAETGRSTYETLWSPIDREIEEGGAETLSGTSRG